MTRRRALSAAATLALVGAASWLPERYRSARLAEAAATGGPLMPPSAADLARPPLPRPASWSARPASATAAVAAFLWSLSLAVAGQAAPPAPESSSGGGGAGAAPPAGQGRGKPPAARASDARTAAAPPSSASGPSGSQGSTPAPMPADAVAAPFTRAYAYLSEAWRGSMPFAAFLKAWAEVRQLEPLAVLSAGSPPGNLRAAVVFAEARLLVTPPAEPDRAVVQYVEGFYVASPGSAGWRLDSGVLRAERFSAAAAGEAGAEAVAAEAARAAARRLGRPGAAGPAKTRLNPRPDHQATASVALGTDRYAVRLYQCVDGAWVALTVDR